MGKDKTNWSAFDKLSDGDIKKAVDNDQDAAPLNAFGLKPINSKAKRAAKVSTTIRLPVDVLEYFKAEGNGWQTRISNTLAEYVKGQRSH